MIKQLNITGYETCVILGNEDFERREKCRVMIDVSLRFSEENEACKSDNLDDTVCYSNLVIFIEEKLECTEFYLLERITRFLYDEISKNLGSNVLKYVKVTKIAPPVENLESASFICSDW
jgi:dihydroneopterin aldolase